jgi:Zn-dependent protease with chaperone function
MINFNNPQKLEIYNAFIDEFSQLFRSLNLDSTTNITCVNTHYPLAVAVTISDDPFATNTIVKPLLIVMNETICNNLNLTQREHFAMIAHEIGHIIDSTPRLGNEMQREINADNFAVSLELTQDLITGLTKIIDSGKYAAHVEGIQARIRQLSDAKSTARM